MFAAIGAHEIGRVAGVFAVAILNERRAPRARVVAFAGTLDLDDFSAKVGEQLAYPRAGEDAAHVEHADASERAFDWSLRHLHVINKIGTTDFTFELMLRIHRRVVLLFLLLWAGACTHVHAQGPALAADINEAVVRIPVIVDGKPNGAYMVGTVFKPDGAGPFPFVVLNHGRAGTASERAQTARWRYLEASRWLVQRGYAVFVATRRGYGETGGTDVEQNYNCNNPWYKEAMAGGVESVLSVIEFAKTQSFVNRNRLVVMGQSVGGYLSVGVAAANPAGLVAAINFAGGHGGRPDRDPGNPCIPEKLKQVFADAGKTSTVPALWIYTENDQYFSPAHTREWHQAFTAAGGKADFRLLPPFGNDGHVLFVRGAKIWQPLLAEFLDSVSF